MLTPPGLMRQKVAVESITTTRNSVGEAIETWATFINTRAWIVPSSGSEVKDGASTFAVVKHRFRMRYRSTITMQMRIRWGSRYFRIDAIYSPQENHRDLFLDCTEIFPEATS